ncbi:phosphoglycerate dehydrogenase [Echinicola sp. CAU 1574]|uniref:Phosphoglycerate dehydrogenase n=1 Tax=Echinicola arenosa TaxID=2774144 RepID=A0ABR9ANG6_9BACT|nr:2-hydroxyacid dehydrogenase [Echinicola arenosa]MBD8490327.1 phosphoglycerate dehydrogenase [Echinicola arenosa]
MKILIIDEMHPSITPLLMEAGFEVNYRPEINRKEILEVVGEYEGLIIRSKTPMDEPLLKEANKLRFIARAGAGLDKIDLDYIAENNIELFHAPEGNRDAVGEHAVAMLLSLFNNLHKSDSEVRKGIWDREGNRGEELQGKTVGVFGYGNMGQAFARRLKGFGVKVLAYDKYREGYGDENANEASFETIQEQADILSIHVPLTDETRNFFTTKVLRGFKKPFYLINTARGEVISLDTLNETLSDGVLKGALLDVLENEKLHTLSSAQKMSFDRLVQRDNVMFSPHIAGWTFQSYEKINQVLVAKIKGKFPLK